MSAAQDLFAILDANAQAIVAAILRAHSDPSSGPVVTSVRYTLDQDWAGDDAIHFTVVLQDPPNGRDFYEPSETDAIRDQIDDLLRGHDIERLPYVSFQHQSEQESLNSISDD